MALTRNKPSWNKGLTGIAAGWTKKRRRLASIRQKQWCIDNPRSSFFLYDKTSRWKTGPDPEVRKHYYRFLRMRCQAKYWNQEWTIKWEDYLDLMKTANGKWGRTLDSINLTRINTLEGWHIDNVELMSRRESMHRKRPIDPATGKAIKRIKKKGRKPKHWRKRREQ